MDFKMEERKDYGPVTIGHLVGVIIFSLILLIGLVAYNSKSPRYVLSPDESLAHISAEAKQLDAPMMAEVVISNDSLYRIIDLRSPRLFMNKHIPGSVNIPMGRLFDKEFESIFNQHERINILIGGTSAESAIAYMMLNDEGFKNIRLVSFGVDFVLTNIIAKFAPLNGKYDEERSIYNYAKIVNETPGFSIDATAAPASVEETSAPVKKKKSSGNQESGGC
jgi:rhodanese-related sulfurtransferase